MNYYELLEIQPNASEEVIKMAYKALVKQYHPDSYKGDISYAEKRLKRLIWRMTHFLTQIKGLCMIKK